MTGGLFAATFWAGALLAAGPTDTVRVEASPVATVQSTVPVFATVHRIEAEDVRDAIDLEAALNQVPGVKMETRGAGGSRRIRMRGSSLRSPFGVRNVFLLLDGFVLTTADGETPMEWMDPELLGGLDAMTGPTGAVLGGGYAGALWAHSREATTSGALRAATLGAGAAGSGGAHFVAAHGAHGAVAASILASQHPGYRAQEANGKWQASIHHRMEGPQRDQHIWLGLYDGWWELPGSLDADQNASSPTAAPGTEYNAHVARRRAALGWSSTRSNQPDQGLWVLATMTDKHNPYGTTPFFNGDKYEQGRGFSLRWARQGLLLETPKSRWSWHAQAIGQGDQTALQELELNGPMTRYDLTSTTGRGWGTAGVRQVRSSGLSWHAGAAANGVHRQTRGSVLDSLPFHEAFSEVRFLPRAGVSVPLGRHLQGFAEWGTGVSIPTTFELVDPNSLAAYDLKSEWGQALEAGMAWERGPLLAQFSAFHQRVDDAISLTPGANDAPVMANADVLNMRGMEAVCSGKAGNWRLRAWTTWNRFEVIALASSAPFTMPGTPLHAAGASSVYEKDRWFVEARWRWNDRSPLNNAGTDWSPAFHRLDAAVRYRVAAWTFRVGVLNASNSAHSDWYQVNAFGGKYYNPVAPRQWEVGVRWSGVTR